VHPQNTRAGRGECPDRIDMSPFDTRQEGPDIKTRGTDIPRSLSTAQAPAKAFIHSRELAAARYRPGEPSSLPEVMAMHAKDVLGRDGEQAAVNYLESCGFRILDRNWRCADGEIDIVAVDRHTFVVCEVKTRTGTRYGTPLEAVGRAKRSRLRKLAVRWLTAHGVRFDQIRIDVVGLLYEGTGGFTIEHLRGVD
jgi:putative endonuclease